MVQSSLLRVVLILSIVTIILFPLHALFVQYPSFQRFLAENISRESERIATLLSSVLIEDQVLDLRPGRAPSRFLRQLDDLQKDSRIRKVKIFSPSGRVLHSTDPAEIGTINDGQYLQDIVRTGRIGSVEIVKGGRSLERETMGFEAIETYVPIVQGNAVVAVIEVYFDVSAEKQQLRTLVQHSAGSVLVLAFVLLFAVMISVLKARRAAADGRRMEEALRASEHRYRALFEHAGDAIFILEAEGPEAGRIAAANNAAAAMHGYTAEELARLRITDLDTLASAQRAPGLIERIVRGEWIKTELDHRRKDGTVFPVEVSAGLLELGERKYILAFDRDITERRRTEAGREKVIGELREALENVSTLRGLLPICASCKKIRDDKGYWNRIESYIASHTLAEFSHGICPDCAAKLYPAIHPPKEPG